MTTVYGSTEYHKNIRTNSIEVFCVFLPPSWHISFAGFFSSSQAITVLVFFFFFFPIQHLSARWQEQNTFAYTQLLKIMYSFDGKHLMLFIPYLNLIYGPVIAMPWTKWKKRKIKGFFFSKRECFEIGPKPKDIGRHNGWITKVILICIFIRNKFLFFSQSPVSSLRFMKTRNLGFFFFFNHFTEA